LELEIIHIEYREVLTGQVVQEADAIEVGSLFSCGRWGWDFCFEFFAAGSGVASVRRIERRWATESAAKNTRRKAVVIGASQHESLHVFQHKRCD
jgi:hypothetical protein